MYFHKQHSTANYIRDVRDLPNYVCSFAIVIYTHLCLITDISQRLLPGVVMPARRNYDEKHPGTFPYGFRY